MSARQFEGLIEGLREAGIIEKGQVVGISGGAEENEKLREIFALKSGNDLRIFHDGMYHVREVLIDLEHAYDPECIAAAKMGLEALKAKIVKDARNEIFKKMRQEVINPLLNPVFGAVADGFAAEAKSRWVLNEQQIREKIEERKRLDALEQDLEQKVAMQELEEQMVASAAVSDVAFVVPNLEHNKAEVLGKLEGKLTSKYGEKLAKFVVTRLAPKFVPLVGQATLAKDVYDAVKAGLEFFESEGIELPEILERSKKQDKTKETKKERSKVVVETATGGGGNDEEPDGDDKKKDENESKDESSGFNPSAEGNYDKVMRSERFGKFYRDAKDPNTWWSKDRAGHGGEHWKKFVEKGKKFIHEADVDTFGNIMTKHKSKVGQVIDFKDLIGIK